MLYLTRYFLASIIGVTTAALTTPTTNAQAAPAQPTASQAARIQDAFKSIQFALIDTKGTTLTRLSTDSGAKIIGVDTVRIAAGDRIKQLLQQRSIRPDGQAIGLMYALNPNIKHVDSLAIGEIVLVPSADKFLNSSRDTNSEKKVAVLVDSLVEVKFRAALREFSALTQNAEVETKFGGALGASIGTVDGLRKQSLNSPVFSAATLDVISNTTGAVKELVQSATLTGRADDATKASNAIRQLDQITQGIDQCRSAGIGCEAELTIVPNGVRAGVSTAEIRMQYAGIIQRISPGCVNNFVPPCQNEFTMNGPTIFRVPLYIYGEFVIWATRGNSRISCDKSIPRIREPMQASIEIYPNFEEVQRNCKSTKLSNLPLRDSARVNATTIISAR